MTETQEQTQETREEAEQKCFCMGAGPEFFSMLKRMGPENARQHFRNARVEVLKGMRALIDRRIEELDQAGGKKGTKVSID